jgi:flagellar motor switch protein FliN/FliY
MSTQNSPSDGPSAADLAAAEAMMAGRSDAAGAEVVAEGAGGDVNLDVILDVPVTLSLEVGRTRLPIRSLLQLNQGSVVELERAAGEPLDVFVNGTLVAHGEVVVVNDKFGIRLIDVVSPAERIRKLK